ncbi:hypothetical protein PHYBLDRAFT_143662 [Phycomyces blakesleeanus NRRL 1555(-)]|uniref:Uncharacterized protein n=1 Tax=Phycomyces blakesleeanus (strain ATCC 8743b / DSM 1359 / FGSC 10004 / NBRC 33097 / NRRL 1555) TaxID=763407 RepID=A0A162PRW7_PHYB8|nr:hypothetical protein PHYBLDRAFT_143662 [Phycomyces blakesleeanus NRRL 1555(-)]OAD75417.1 hypothetical protein PHYBLDRAFT_143662 [Phycomyces blakesleeanus NRRL 1555(-)]|eukprot:XP_018293457.1 hypothetical protein PHYBLDRAFT_143662 [Phycomyces blakesleeanus NRRL 1555(-)]
MDIGYWALALALALDIGHWALALFNRIKSGLLVVLVAVTAHAIWRAHRYLIFKESPFLASVVAARASSVVALNLGMRMSLED